MHTTAASSVNFHTLAIFEQRYNWPGILDDLTGAGCSLPRVAMILGAGHATVYGWYKEGKEPRYGFGQALRVLHATVCGEAMSQKRETEAKKAA